MSGKVRNAIRKFYYHFPLESLIWISGLLILAFYDPAVNRHISICFFDRLGFRFCPGCGLGRSVSFLMHGDIIHSLQAHPAGMPAFLILSFRIFRQGFGFFSGIKININKNG